MGRVKNKIVTFVVIFALTLSFVLVNYKQPIAAYAENVNDLHTTTRISSKTETNPTITVLTHGLGSQSYYWSNRYDYVPDESEGEEHIVYNEYSLINRLYQKLDGQMALYVARGDVTEIEGGADVYDFDLVKYTYADYQNDREGKTVPMLDDVSKHIVIVYNSKIKGYSNSDVYEEFHYILDNISLQYKRLTGVLPRFNLVGHSRGGITNIMYATEHPYNVASIYSMGAPYNGSKLGEIDLLMDFMGYVGDDGDLSPGAASIMDKEGNKAIRNAWNQTLSTYPDADINAVTFGSITSLSIVSAMVSDVKNNSAKYGDKYSGFIDEAEVIVRLMSYNADLTNIVLNVVAGIAGVANFFNYDVCDALVSAIDPSLQGQVKYEDVRPVVDLIQKVNDQTVILDDLFIDVNSQLGFGFDDGISYNGFTRYVKTFTEEDYTDNRAIADQPGVVHNLEIMNPIYINKITSDLICGVPVSNITALNESFTGSFTIDDIGKAFSISSEHGGKRTFNASGCDIKLYRYDENDCLTDMFNVNEDGTGGNIVEVENYLTFDFLGNEDYLLIVAKDYADVVNVSFETAYNVTEEESVTFTVDAGRDELFTISVDKTSYYIVTFYGFSGTISGLNGNATNGFCVYLSAGEKHCVYLDNAATNLSTIIVNVTEAPEIDINTETTVSANGCVVKYNNDNSIAMAYRLELSGINADFNATIYDDGNNTISSVIVSENKKTYSFVLGASETCFIVYEGDYTSLKSIICLNETQLVWKIDGKECGSTKVQLPRGKSYTVELISLASNTTWLTDFVFTSSTNFTFVNSVLHINSNALIGYDIVICPYSVPSYLLTVQVGFNNDFSWYVSNSDTVNIVWTSNEPSLTIDFSIKNSDGERKISATSNNINVTSYLPQSVGTSTFTLNAVTVPQTVGEGVTYENGTEFLNIGDVSVNNLFGDGDTVSYPITCYRHLNNIRYDYRVNREDDSKYINDSFKLMNNITLVDNWVPIPYRFKGELDGNYKTLYNLAINVTQSYGSHGLFAVMSTPIIHDLTIRGVYITSTGINNGSNTVNPSLYIGTLAGQSNGGRITNCHVYGQDSYKTISVSSYYRTNVGGLIGFNCSNISGCSINNIDMTVSSDAGGIAGNSMETIDNCTARNLHITYVWNTENACLGGIVGRNLNGVVTNCTSTASSSGFVAFTWYSPDDLTHKIKKTIYPSIGYVIGQNEGTYSNLSKSSYLTTNIDYHWRLLAPNYDQSDRMFKVADECVGYEP